MHLSKFLIFLLFQSAFWTFISFVHFTGVKLQPEVYEFSGISNSARKEESSIGGIAALINVGEPTNDGILGTTSAPIDKVAALEGENFKEQLWHAIWFVAGAFLLICGVGAHIVYKGINKGIITVSL